MATATKDPFQGTLTKSPSERHYVKWLPNGGKDYRYGQVRRIFSQKASAFNQTEKDVFHYAQQGMLVIDDAITPVAICVKESQVEDVPVGMMDDKDEYYQYVQNAYHDAQEASDKIQGVRVGKLFAIGVADGHAYYVVTAVKTKSCDIEWRGFCPDRYTDHFFGWGRKGVPIKDVKPYITRADAFTKLREKKDDSFLDQQEVGKMLHYHHGFGQYVRCEVVLAAEDRIQAERMGKRPSDKKIKMLSFLGLVGAWSKNDLPSYDKSGKEVFPYWFKDQKPWRPDESCIFEAPGFVRPNGVSNKHTVMGEGTPLASIDPNTFNCLFDSLPVLTDEEKAMHAAYKLLGTVNELSRQHTVLGATGEKFTPAEEKTAVDNRLREIFTLISAHLGK